MNAQELLFYERVEDVPALVTLDAAQAMDLHRGQPQTRHLEKLRTDSVDGSHVGSRKLAREQSSSIRREAFKRIR
jgi:hypothetical protein